MTHAVLCGVRMGAEAEEEIPCRSTTCCVAHDIPVSFRPLPGKRKEKNEDKKRREKKNGIRPITDLYQDYGHWQTGCLRIISSRQKL